MGPASRRAKTIHAPAVATVRDLHGVEVVSPGRGGVARGQVFTAGLTLRVAYSRAARN